MKNYERVNEWISNELINISVDESAKEVMNYEYMDECEWLSLLINVLINEWLNKWMSKLSEYLLGFVKCNRAG